MTQVAEPGVARSDAADRGTRQPLDRRADRRGYVRPRGPGLRPGNGPGDEAGRLRVGRRGRSGRRRGQGGLPGLAGDLAVEADGDHVPDPQPRGSAPARAGGAPDRGARQGPHRRARRDRPRPREPRVRLFHPDTCSRAASPSRRAPASTSTRSASRSASWPGSRPFNFPAMVPMWMFATAIATRQHVHPQAVGEGPVGVQLHGRAAARGRRPGRRLQRRPRRQGRGRRDPRAPRHRRRQLRRLDADRALHLRDRDARPASGSRRSAAPRTT